MPTILNSNIATQDEISTLAGSVIPVWDTTISDHANAATAGSIAWAIAKAEAAGGGQIVIGPGTFNLTSNRLLVPEKVDMRGCGTSMTIINQTNTAYDGVKAYVANGQFGQTIESFRVAMPAAAASGKSGVLVEGVGQRLESIHVVGGSANSWGFTFDNFYNTNATHIVVGGSAGAVQASSSGFRFLNAQNTIRPGDCTFSGLQAWLKAAATGFSFEYDQGKVGNLTFTQPWCVKSDGLLQGIGYNFGNFVSRVTLIGSDAEGFDTAYTFHSGVSEICLVNPAESGCTTKFVNNASLADVTVIGQHPSLAAYESYLRVTG